MVADPRGKSARQALPGALSLAAPVAAASVSGSIAAAGGADAGPAGPSRVTVDVTLTFAANDAGAPASETLAAPDVDVTAACP